MITPDKYFVYKSVETYPNNVPTVNRFWSYDDAAPQWLKDAVRECHQNSFPSDWIFSECAAVWSYILENKDSSEEDLRDLMHEHADSNVEPYTKDLFSWCAVFCCSKLYSNAEERAEELCAFNSHTTVVDLLRVIQFCALSTIAETMLVAFLEHRDELRE